MTSKGKSFTNGAGRTRERRLLLCLDGVPHEVIAAAKGRGLFKAFGEPSRLLSPFPTMTNIALSCMLNASAPHGYESLYFDRKARELRGGVSKYIGRRTPDKAPSSYMEKLDYQEPLAFEFLVYVAPEAVWRADMQRFRERFRHAPQDRDFFAFLKGTDGLLHIRGRKRLEAALESLDRILTEIHEWCGRETEIVLFSDHGMNLQENRRVNLQTHLTHHGYSLTDRLGTRAPQSVAIPAFGLCGYAALYCGREEDAPALADTACTLEGVDFALHRDESDAAVLVKGARGAARIVREEKASQTLYRYEQLTGDPLQLAGVVRSLREENLLDESGNAPDSAWYARTAAHIYPDALSNLYGALHAVRVGHTADVLLSMQDGYYYGSSFFSRLVRLAATHGNALRASTNAFLMSTHRAFPLHVRASEARPYLQG
ncbi:MAG: alkaline phosphatase family protein [Acidobacteria bacterium]|nr:alkaline phosphatase family protein [Acidobacteriota bacterium]